jgi:MFS family permease
VGDTVDAAPISPYLPLRKVLAVGLGNALEFYDFLTFSFFAIQIGHCFFPPSETANGLVYSLATFGVGFLTRPLGGFFIGRYGDRAGRRPAMMLSFTLMGVGIMGLALTPSYATIGMAAPVLLLFFRLLQGFALGGEIGPSTAFLIEAAPPLKRGIYVAFQYATADSGVMLAGIVGFCLANTLSPEALDQWGWRVAFLIGVSVVPVGLSLRRRLPETLPERERTTTRPTIVPQALIVLSLMMLGSGTISSYALDYMTTYAQDSLHLAAGPAFGATIVLGVCSVAADVTSGLLSDRVGRKPVMLAAAIGLALLAVPGFIAMEHWRSAATVYGVTAALGALQGLASGPAFVMIAEALPKAVRSGALSLIYAIAIAVFGGSTQLVIKELLSITDNILAPAWYLTGALVIGGIAMAIMRETAPVRTGRGEDMSGGLTHG